MGLSGLDGFIHTGIQRGSRRALSFCIVRVGVSGNPGAAAIRRRESKRRMISSLSPTEGG